MVTHRVDIGHNGVALQLGGDVLMPHIPQSGYCIVRAEVQGDNLQITVITNTSTTRTVRTAPSEQPCKTVHIDEALEVVEKFLRDFVVNAE
jgi:hypothetical protein